MIYKTRVLQTERERVEMGRDDDYSFLQIVDARRSLNQRVNLIGVVVDTSIPKQSRGTDCFCTIRIVDESSSSPGIPVNIFAENMIKLPRVESAGDIIQLSRVVMKIHGGEVYALFNKKFSGFALFEGKQSANYVPYQASMNFRSREHDKKILEGLRKWSSCNQLDGGLSQAISLKEIKVGVRLNVMCKVLHVCEVSDGNWIAFVWDGTDTPATSIQSRLEEEMEKPLPLQLEPFTLSREILCTFPAVGTVLRVIIDQGNDKFDLNFLRIGRWVVFINIIFEVESGLWRGMLMTFTKLRFLSDDDPIATQFQRNNDERVFSKWGRMPLSSFPYCSHVTETDHEDVPFVTLMNILIYPEVTAKFRCVVRVVSILPWQAEDFRSPKGIFRIRLTLEDPTARIHAYVYAEDGEKFLDSNSSTDVLKRMRNKLLGIVSNDDGDEIRGAPRDPPWIDCCIKSYYLDKNDLWRSRKYRIFDTKVVQY